jgi:hypothetical protein
MQHLKQMKVKYGFIFSTQKSDGQISTWKGYKWFNWKYNKSGNN